ncbi:DNA cytosine methyltransferase [Bifidobacterium sp. W8109]|uniref:DNA cytosine methyltransferase n=1 Tax=Bifidobacterium TaxID=1678 RepID=UPI0018DCA373|nr:MULTISPECIES: DNA cytosine methyltransferase [Bifidobacterium]MBH9970810.1 DNA cytosine methyltransferase [Bifidobacterium asteroides]MBI0072867.1 DNA cytosine methyltransferase [Bifidobacterium sp. W8110]
MNSVKAENSYISLFSSGGIGDIGFHDEHFFCIASAELLSKRIEIQRINHIADDNRLICGDLLLPGPFETVLSLAENYMEEKQQPITAVIATPPCQGMSVANHKKGDELKRNSLVVRSIELIQKVKPLVFIFENVPAFMKTICTGQDGINRPIKDEIESDLGATYEFYSHVLQLSNYGSPSSRTRSLTIGVRNDITWVTPLDLFPSKKSAPTLRDLIGDLPRLTEMGQSSEGDVLHSFRPYNKEMRSWIHDLKEGHSAFENKDPLKRPHRVVDGKVIQNVQKNGDKYRRVPWDAVAPCVHTRNDILASQNTIHPEDDRVFSIRELMRMMGVRDDYHWFDSQTDAGSCACMSELKNHALNIRQCLGEAIPVPVTQSIARHISKALTPFLRFSSQRPRRAHVSNWASEAQKCAYVEVSELRKKSLSAYYTEPLIAFSVVKRSLAEYKENRNKAIKILEPSCGSGVFIQILNQFAEFYPIDLDCLDIDAEVIKQVKKRFQTSNNFINLTICRKDFLKDCSEMIHDFDLIIGNPPFGRRKLDKNSAWGKDPELSVRFLRKAVSLAERVAFVLPKAFLHAAYYQDIRNTIASMTDVRHILDFGEFTFHDAKIETIGLVIEVVSDYRKGKNLLKIKSWPQECMAAGPSEYYLDCRFPTWIIYRNSQFDKTVELLKLGVFRAWRDRRISRRLAVSSGIRVLRGRNIGMNGHLEHDSRDYKVSKSTADSVSSSIARLPGNSKFLAPNLSYNPRVIEFESGKSAVPDGSCAVLYGDLNPESSRTFLSFADSKQFQSFYRIACNYSTRSINIDSCLVYWWGVPKNPEKIH